MAKRKIETTNAKNILLAAACVVRQHGWVSKGDARATGAEATADIVRDTPTAELKPNRTDVGVVKRALAWVATLAEVAELDPKSYEGKLYLALFEDKKPVDVIATSAISLVVSAIGVFTKREQAQKKAAKVAKTAGPHVGAAGERLEFDATCTEKRYLRRWDSFVYTFVDANGSHFGVFSRSETLAKEGTKVRLRGTVKDHRTFNGIPSTSLNRAKILSA